MPPALPGDRRRQLYLLAASACTVAVSRWLTAGAHLWSWDSVNFALALTTIDLSQHQPHPPGYFGYIFLARLLRLGSSENIALLRIGVLSTVLTCVLIWRFSHRLYGSHGASWLAWTLVAFSPLHWFYGSVAEIYATELALTLSIAYAAYGMCRCERFSPVALSVAIFSGLLLKSPSVILMIPLIGYAFLQTDGATRRRGGTALTVAVAAAVAALGFFAPLNDIAASLAGESSLLTNFNLRVLNRSARDMVYAAFAALGAGALVAMAGGRSSGPRIGPFLAIWSCGYLLVCLFVHFPKPGYLLPLLPVMVLGVCGRAASFSRRRLLLTIVTIVCVDIAHFAFVPPFSASETGDGMRYRDKSLAQKFSTEANSILRPSTYAIHRLDAALDRLLDEIAIRCGTSTRQVVIVAAGGTLSTTLSPSRGA